MFGGSMLFQPFRITDCLKTTLGMPRSDYIIWFLGMKPAGSARRDSHTVSARTAAHPFERSTA
jgi:hypothetical protein